LTRGSFIREVAHAGGDCVSAEGGNYKRENVVPALKTSKEIMKR